MSRFYSGFDSKLEGMLEYRTSLGYKEISHIRNVIRFDKYCFKYFPEANQLTQEIVYAWFDDETANAHCLTDKATTIRQFGKYLCAVGEEAYMLPEKFTPKKKTFNPYIFTDSELSALFAEIDKLQSNPNEPFLNEMASVLFRLTYTCGLRPNEGRALLCENINLCTGEIIIKNTKRRKERIVVISNDMLGLCQNYEQRRQIFGCDSPYFFPANNANALSSAKVLAAFNKAWLAANLTLKNSVQQKVRVYDLRNTHINKILTFLHKASRFYISKCKKVWIIN